MEYGLIGEKLTHSYSKLIQEKLLDNYTYEICPIEKDYLDFFMKEKAFKAINVTIPYKQSVLPYLDELDITASKIGAVNTIVNKNGYLKGYNTDYYGFKYMIDYHNIDLTNKKVLIMGNGGASKAIQAVIKDYPCKCILIVDIVLEEGILSIEEVYENHKDVDVIVNTTPLGMYPNVSKCCVDLSKFTRLSSCIDVIYNPYQTEFTLQAKKLGVYAISGLEMLVAQAKYALEYFKDISIDDCEINRIYKEILSTTTNIISTNKEEAMMLAKKLNKEFIDLNELMKDENLTTLAKQYGVKTNLVIYLSKSYLTLEIEHELARNKIM